MTLGFSSEQARSITATLRTPRHGEHIAPLPSGITLSVLNGPDCGTHELMGTELNIGRGQLCDVRLTDSSISEFHFKLLLANEEILLEDLGSRNGVWIGRAQVQRARLLPGAIFRAGSCRFRLDRIETTNAAITDQNEFHGIHGISHKMRSLFALLARSSKTPIPLLITGETGCGKGLAARAIHRASGRKGSFVTLDCTALPRDMAEALVLGHTKGAFTGAHRDRPSPFEQADGGTLFLDEIGELPPDLQPKLLRVVDEQVVQRVGASASRPVDVRIISATHRDLTQLISSQRFRLDLFHRLAGMVVPLPTLRSRKEDIPHLATLFLEQCAKEMNRELSFSDEAMLALETSDWRGNVRELLQTVQRSAYLSEGPTVERDDLMLGHNEEEPHKVVKVEDRDGVAEEENSDTELPYLEQVLDQTRRSYCTKLLACTSSLTEAADIAGYSPRGLRMLLKRLNIPTQ